MLVRTLLASACIACASAQAHADAPQTTLPAGPEKALVQRHCAKCHELQWIEQAEGTETAWVTRIRRMIRRGSDIPPERVAQLATYLAQALPPRVRQQSLAASPIATTVSEVTRRPIQTWVRGAGDLQSDLATIVATLSLSDAALVKVGQRVRTFALSSRSSMYQGRVARVAIGTAAAHVHIKLTSTGRAANEIYLVEIIAEQAPLLSVPNEAIIEEGSLPRETGRRLVYIQRRSGDYVPREIATGLQGELYTEVVSGLKEGEHVVTFGSFFIDAEYKMKGAQ